MNDLIDRAALKKLVAEPSLYDINVPDVLALIDDAPTIDAAAGRALKMEERVRQLEAERDAAVKELKAATTEGETCYGCKWYNGKDCTHELYPLTCSSRNNHWQWRGVQKEATHD